MILHIRNCKESIKKQLNSFFSVTEPKNQYTKIRFLYTSNEQSKRKLRKKFHFQ
jgi:hypothetical protein